MRRSPILCPGTALRVGMYYLLLDICVVLVPEGDVCLNGYTTDWPICCDAQLVLKNILGIKWRPKPVKQCIELVLATRTIILARGQIDHRLARQLLRHASGLGNCVTTSHRGSNRSCRTTGNTPCTKPRGGSTGNKHVVIVCGAHTRVERKAVYDFGKIVNRVRIHCPALLALLIECV